MKPRIVRVLRGVNMALGHDGLLLLIKRDADLDLRTMAGSDMVLCINAAEDRIKAIGGGGVVLGYLKMPHGRRLMREAVQFIPRVFGGDGFTYDDACRQALEDGGWNRRLTVPSGANKVKFINTFVKEATQNA